jgi:ELWxxDGT repeat protein
LFADLNPGTAGSFPGNMAVIDNTLYFSATTATGSAALWSSDGTVTRTKQVASFGSQPDGTAIFTNIPDAFGVIGGSMVFAADSGSSDTELWKTDGTAAGTSTIKVIAPSQLGYTPSDFTTVGGKVFFVTQTATDTLWVTDGTTAGTTAIATFDGTIADPMAFDGKLAFIESSLDRTEASLWLSDGTVSGTTEVTSFPTQSANYYPQTPTMTESNGTLFISAPPLPNPLNPGLATLWVSDGTAAGTMPIPGVPETANVDALAVFDGHVYFTVNEGSKSILQPGDRAQLWVTDGTAAGTRMVTDVGAADATIDDFFIAGPNLYMFTSRSGSPAAVLYKTNGTKIGTVLIHQFTSPGLDAAAGLPNGDLAFEFNGRSSNPFWLSNGTVAGTVELKKLAGGGGYIGDGGGAITPINGVVFIQGSDPDGHNSLWQSNGTVAGTTLVQDISSSGGVFSGPYALTELNGNLIVAAAVGDHGLELLSEPIPAAPATLSSMSARSASEGSRSPPR